MSLPDEVKQKLSDHGTWVKGKLKEFADKDATPHEVALGFSLGLFVALATPGIDILVALFLTVTFKLHRLAVLFGVAFIDNPLSIAVIYPTSFEIGRAIVGFEPINKADIFSLHNFLSISKPLFVGNFILALVLGVIAYFASYNLYYWWHYRKKHEE